MDHATEADRRANFTFTVLIPAHNEANVISRTLQTILEGTSSDQAPDIIVVCNGCTDDTASVARKAAPQVKVLELAVGSKALAINAGLDEVRAAPVIVVDGDIEINHESLFAVAETLRQPGVMAASPVAKIELAACDRWTRSYYRVWAGHDFLRSGVGGSGVYGLSEAAIRQIGRFPRIIADDTYVRWEFPLSQQRRVQVDGNGKPICARVKPQSEFLM